MANPGPIYEESLTVDGSTTFQKCVGPVWVSLSGGFGGGTAKIQRKNAAGTAVDIAGESHTVVADRLIDFPEYAVNEVRVNIASSTSPTLAVSLQWTSPYQQQRL